MKANQKLVALVREILLEASRPPEGCNCLFRTNLKIHPVPFFGDITRAEIITLGVNPSSTEFEPWRGWPLSLDECCLTARLLDYFNRKKPKPHPWFAHYEESLNILGYSYSERAAHIDLSPRATMSMRSLRTADSRCLFTRMVTQDAKKWLPKLFGFCHQAKLVLTADSIIDFDNPRGIGLGQFIAKNFPAFWASLVGRRFPRQSCSRRQLPYKIYANKAAILQSLGENGT
jgi:hypothetical protein